MIKNLFVWIVAAAIAAASFVHAAASAFPLLLAATVDVETSLTGRAQAETVDKLYRSELALRGREAFASNALAAASPQLQSRAKSAYSVNPLDVAVMRTLALGVVLPADPGRGRAAMRIAMNTSRRDVLTDLWLAQDYAQTQRLDAALEMFDAALRTSNAARASVMDPFLNLIGNEDSHRPIGKLLAQRPEWEWDFWFAFASNPVALQNAADFMRDASVSPSDLDPSLLLRLYRSLKSANLYDQLFGVGLLDPRAREIIEAQKRGNLKGSDGANPFSWQLRSEGSYSAYVDDSQGSIRIDAESHVSGTAGRLILPVKAGESFQLDVSAQVPASTLLRVSVQCATDIQTGELARLLLTPEIGTASSIVDRSKCRYLDVRLYFDASESDQRTSILVNRIVFVPVSNTQ